MIVGRTAVLRGPAWLTAGATSVQASGRACAVDGGTPLAALDSYRRLGGPGILVKDYGSCSRASGSASQSLFVYQVGYERNRGADGWVSKVNGRTGSTGAADPLGPFGNRQLLRSGDQVVWFWCHMGTGGCQRTLVVSAAGVARARAAVRVSVRGLDDQGRSTPIRNATVSLGSTRAATSSRGTATLSAPSQRGSYELNAGGSGLIPAFPEAIAVR